MEKALNELKNVTSTTSSSGGLDLSEATIKTTNVNVAQAKLEMVQGVVKGALKVVDKQSKHLVQ